MEKIIKTLSNCRICESTHLTKVISLGEQYITSRFPLYGDFSTPKTPIDLCVCENCRLLQLYQTTNSSELYEYEYGYRSGISNTMKEHLKTYQEEIVSIVQLNDGDTIVDIGSNDSTMLQYYSDKLKRIGVDPTGVQFKEYYKNVELLPTYFTYDNFKNKYGDLKCKMVSSISMFYDLPDPVQFANDVYNILDENGIWTCEQSYLITMLKTNSIDTICHEHLEYYSLKQIKEIADRSGFKIIDIKFNSCNGGSFRIYFAKRNSKIYNENIDLIREILKHEDEYGLNNNDIFFTFMNNCEREVTYLRDFINVVNKNNKKVYIYGASTKGNCLLQYANLGEKDIKYAVERNPKKIGKMTNTGIEIISEETMREKPPDFLLVLPWHFREEILKREEIFLNNGGQFIFPFPQFEIIGSKPKLLITGCDGMISSYIKKQMNEYNLYGFGKTNKNEYERNITKFYFDMNNLSKLEQNLSIIKPDVIVHLAAISSSQYALNNPIETLHTNGIISANLCDIIYRNKWNIKLFNASSSEVYKGHVDYEVAEDDHNMYHLHPYSIAKIMGTSIVDFYRKEYNLPFSNGFIFTTESPLKRKEFLLNKVVDHIYRWKKGEKKSLIVGNLDSYRSILHASDAANAIQVIISQEKGDNYLICSNESYKMLDLVIKLFEKANILIEKRENKLYEKETELEILVINEQKIGFDTSPINIRGDATKLKHLGWKPFFSMDDILEDLITV